jgi:ketosteroid isomerase-like protein
MRNFKFLSFAILISLIFIAPAFGQKAAAAVKPDPTKPVRDAFERLLEGIRQADAAKVMGVYDNSPRTLFFNNNGSVTLGWDTMKKNRESSYAKTKDVALEVKGVRVEMLGPKAAYVSCTWTQSQVYDGKLENAAGRMTLIFKLIGKDWKVVHLHTSPASPAADRPVLESEKTTVPIGNDHPEMIFVL